jgi:hypothetical protein
MQIAARVRQEAPAATEKAPGWFAGPRAWQLGLAATAVLCTIVVVRQFPQLRQENRETAAVSVAESKAFSDALAPKEDSARTSEQQAAAQQGELALLAPSQTAQAEEEDLATGSSVRESNEVFGGAAGSLGNTTPRERSPQDAGFQFEAASPGGIAPDVQAESAPVQESASAQASRALEAQNLTDRPGRSSTARSDDQAGLEKAGSDLERRRLAVADLRARQSAPASAAPASAAAPSPAPQPGQQTEADAGVQRDQAASLRASQNIAAGAGFRPSTPADEQRKNERAELAQTPRASAGPPQVARAQESGLAGNAVAGGNAVPEAAERGFTILPAALQDPRVDVGVAADGWISIRSVDATTGTITITDVYVP